MEPFGEERECYSNEELQQAGCAPRGIPVGFAAYWQNRLTLDWQYPVEVNSTSHNEIMLAGTGLPLFVIGRPYLEIVRDRAPSVSFVHDSIAIDFEAVSSQETRNVHYFCNAFLREVWNHWVSDAHTVNAEGTRHFRPAAPFTDTAEGRTSSAQPNASGQGARGEDRNYPAQIPEFKMTEQQRFHLTPTNLILPGAACSYVPSEWNYGETNRVYESECLLHPHVIGSYQKPEASVLQEAVQRGFVPAGMEHRLRFDLKAGNGSLVFVLPFPETNLRVLMKKIEARNADFKRKLHQYLKTRSMGNEVMTNLHNIRTAYRHFIAGTALGITTAHMGSDSESDRQIYVQMQNMIVDCLPGWQYHDTSPALEVFNEDMIWRHRPRGRRLNLKRSTYD